jgi:hypothetical protein
MSEPLSIWLTACKMGYLRMLPGWPGRECMLTEMLFLVCALESFGNGIR